ncbi:hypothetical protein F4677DRAFT_297159 [Hypoxylon crocopeplum]|nr:hypothetical protein F4677DRAFT_297159 [Hypoxylon crocopeplum]
MLYRRLFPQRPVYIVLYITTGIMVSTAIASLIADLAACDPFSANWASPDIQATHCINKEALFVWSTFPNIVTDVIMLLLPLPIIWRLHTPTQLKVALTCTFLLGSIGLIASILRFATFSNTNSFIDATYNAVELVIWTIAEPSVYLISACVLMYRPLLEKIGIGSLSSSSKASDSRAYKQHPGTESRRMGRALESGDRSIALRSLSANRGFEQLFDDERSIHGRDQFLRASITTTAHFQPPERGV